MLLPNQFQDLAVILNTDAKDLESLYTSSEVELTDELAIIDILSDSIKESDFKKIREILSNYPLFDNILLKMNIVEQVQHIEKLPTVHIVENLTKDVLKSFENTPLYNILKEAEGKTIEEKNKFIKNKIMETISPKSYLKPIMEGISVSRDKKPMFESLSNYDLSSSNKILLKKIRELHRYMSTLNPINGKQNPLYNKCKKELEELEALYDEKFGFMNEDAIQPIQPIEGINPVEDTTEKADKQEKFENQIQHMDNADATEAVEDMLDAHKEIDPDVLKRAMNGVDVNPENLTDMYSDMSKDELEKHLDAIDKLL